MRAYDETYLDRARVTLGHSFDFAVRRMGLGLNRYVDLFVASGVARRFGEGDPSVLAGLSGVELAMLTVEEAGAVPPEGLPARPVDPEGGLGRSVEYWTGWAAASYQWARAISFDDVFRIVPAEDLAGLYDPYHEMDVRQLFEHVDQLAAATRASCPLKSFRGRMGMTQRQLAEASGVPLRTLQQYEQGQKRIGAANASYVVALSRVLCCEPADLLAGP